MTKKQNIPKILHQIWLGPNVRPDLWMKTWQEKHPDWEYKLWTEKNIPLLRNQKQFDLIKDFAGKADILRYELLYKYGGVYIDADAECLRPLDDSLLRHHFFACYDNEIVRSGMIANGFIGSESKHPIFLAMMEEIEKIGNVNEKNAWEVVGPLLFTKVISRYKIYNRNVVILPSYKFLPEHYSGFTYVGKGKIYATHHWYTTEKKIAGALETKVIKWKTVREAQKYKDSYDLT